MTKPFMATYTEKATDVMNKSKAKRLRKELEHEQLAADRGHAVQVRRLTEQRRRKELAMLRAGQLTIKQLTPVQVAVHLDEKQALAMIEAAAILDAQPVPSEGRQVWPHAMEPDHGPR